MSLFWGVQLRARDVLNGSAAMRWRGVTATAIWATPRVQIAFDQEIIHHFAAA
jgi:hypothetical protein